MLLRIIILFLHKFGNYTMRFRTSKVYLSLTLYCMLKLLLILVSYDQGDE
ncbi:hypothetical protein LINPERHAP2_LOCUS30416 [Linum perenne]